MVYFGIISQGQHSEAGTFNPKPQDWVDINEEKIRSSGEKVRATFKLKNANVARKHNN